MGTNNVEGKKDFQKGQILKMRCITEHGRQKFHTNVKFCGCPRENLAEVVANDGTVLFVPLEDLQITISTIKPDRRHTDERNQRCLSN